MSVALIWYCRRCRKVLKARPRGAAAKGCACKVPQIGQPTKVWQ